jgi:ankyrin repeat protein
MHPTTNIYWAWDPTHSATPCFLDAIAMDVHLDVLLTQHQKDSIGCTPLHFACMKEDTSIAAIKALIKNNPSSVQLTTDKGCGPLHPACLCSSMSVIRCLISSFPDAAAIRDITGWTPLHYLCFRRPGSGTSVPATVHVAELLIDCYPQALMTQNDGGASPLHFACYTRAPIAIIRLLVKRCPQSVRLVDQDGDTPLNCVCSMLRDDDEAHSDEVIRLLVDQDPSTLFIRDKKGLTALHHACSSDVSIGTLQYMVQQCCHVVCLFLDTPEGTGSDFFLPLQWAIDQDRDPPVIQFLTDATADAACAVIELALNPRGSMPTNVRLHVLETVKQAVPGVLSGAVGDTVGSAPSATIRQHLTDNLVRTLVDHDDLQSLLKEDQHFQSLIGGVVRINQSSGRQYVRDESSDNQRRKAMIVLDSVSDNVDCLYLHLLENPELCLKAHSVSETTSTVVARRSRKRKIPELIM